VFAPPNVRRLARELTVDITTVEGSGPGGRITESDVREAVGAGGADDQTVESAISQADDRSDSGPKSAVKKASDSERKSAVKKAGDTKGTAAGSVEAADRDRTLAAPATRKVAQELDIDINEVPTEKTRDGEPFVEADDIHAYADAKQVAAQAAQETAEQSSVQQTPETATADTAATETGAATAAATESADAVTREPYRGIRRTIGKQMEKSAYTAPHVTHHDTADVSELVELRSDLKPRAEDRGIKLTYLPFIVKAIIAGLREYPMLNSTLDEENEEILYKKYYNIGIAVATDAGLMVPVVKNADEKGMLQIASETNELAGRARERDLSRDEMQDGTFSVTNFGAIGGEYATPIINYPETAILGLGSIKQRPVVEDGEVVARHTLPLSLSIDHRVIDGAQAAAFANTVKEYLENPGLLMLE